MDRREERQAGTSRLVGLHDDDGSFDRAFWSNVPPEERLALVWDLAVEYMEWRGDPGAQQGLQRSVCRVERVRR
jgi:hypothetical protein